jgi:uncharacterized protein
MSARRPGNCQYLRSDPKAGRRLVLFARFPVPGRTKTRLIPALGALGAVALHRRLVLHALRAAQALRTSLPVDLEVRFADGNQDAMNHWLGDELWCRQQGGGNLGERMARAFDASFREGAMATVLIGSDCPGLTPERLAAAFDSLHSHPAVLGPATDGGYYLIGLTRSVPELFQGVNWGTGTVLRESLQILKRIGLKPKLLEPLADLDRAEDLPAWHQLVQQEDADSHKVSVILPAWNDAAHIEASIQSVQAGHPHEVLVVDGGSVDGTQSIATTAGAKVLSSRPGRARQMNAGAARATGNVLLFLHADTQLPVGWPTIVQETLRLPGVVAGAFGFQIKESFAGRWWIEHTTNLRSRWLQSPYGDQGQFLRRALFEELGGFANLPILEDYELMRRLRPRGRILTSKAAAITSGQRWLRLGVLRTTLLNSLMIVGYHFGMRPSQLVKWYRFRSQSLTHAQGQSGPTL